MTENMQIPREQVIYLAYASGFGNVVYTFTYVAAITGRAFWLAVFLGVLLTIPLAAWIMVLGKFAPGGTIFDLLEQGIGKWISWPLILIFCIINIATAVDMLNMFTGAVKVYFLPLTPASAIMLIIVVMCVLFVGSGIQVLARLIEIISILAMTAYFAAFILSFTREFKVEYVIPIFDTPLTAFVKGVFATLGMMSESLLLIMIMIKSISHPEKHPIWVAKGIALWAVLLSVAIFIMGGAVGSDMLSRVAHAGISVGRLIQIGEFIRGLEVFILTTYQFFVVYKTCIYLYCIWVAESQLLGGKKSIFQLVLTAVLVLVGSILMNSFTQGYFYSISLGNFVILPFSLLVLVLASLAALIKRRQGRKVS